MFDTSATLSDVELYVTSLRMQQILTQGDASTVISRFRSALVEEYALYDPSLIGMTFAHHIAAQVVRTSLGPHFCGCSSLACVQR